MQKCCFIKSPAISSRCWSQAVTRVSIKMTHGTESFSTLSSLPERTTDLWQPLRVGRGQESKGKVCVVYTCACLLCSVAKQEGVNTEGTRARVSLNYAMYQIVTRFLFVVCFSCLSASPASWLLLDLRSELMRGNSGSKVVLCLPMVGRQQTSRNVFAGSTIILWLRSCSIYLPLHSYF